MSSSASSGSYNSPCAACKFLRRKCMPGCIFAPYFPPEEPQKFANVHKIFGASNVTKLLNELLPHQREDAVNSLAYEAEARVRDPVYGCVSAISFLQRQIQRLQKELDLANADLLRYACNGISPPSNQQQQPMMVQPMMVARRVDFSSSGGGRTNNIINHNNNIGDDDQGGVYFQTPPPPPYSSLPWVEDNHLSGDHNGDHGGGGY